MSRKDAIRKGTKGIMKNTVAMQIDMNRLSLLKLKNFRPAKSESLKVQKVALPVVDDCVPEENCLSN